METHEFERARGLFKGFDFQVVVRAVIEETSPGKIWVDDTSDPRAGFMATTEGWFLAGTPTNQQFNEGLRELIHRMILEGDYYSPVNPEFLNELFFHIDSDEWRAKFPLIFDIRTPLPTRRIHFVCTRTQYDWRSSLPKGYRILEVNEGFEMNSLEFPEDIKEWIEHSLEDQKRRGFGKCLVHGDRVVVWINADCASGNECEIGIITTQDYRRRGLGVVAAAAAVDDCLSGNFSLVGWHCEDHNYGSIAVAEKVGFVREREYVHYICMFDEAVHYAESGMRSFYAGRHRDAIADFQRAINSGKPPVWTHILAAQSFAAMGEPDQAIDHLAAAKNRGWTEWSRLLDREGFQSLFSSEQWERILTLTGNL